MPGMDLRHLRYFVAVAEELHFGRAAIRLRMTQPPLSQAILALEEELGVALFARTRRSVALTPVGREWLGHVRRLLDDATALPGIARRLARGELGALRLAFVSTADYSVLPPILSRYRAAYPEVVVALREATGDFQIEALLAGEIDAGMIVAPHGTSPHVSLSYRPLIQEPLIAAVPQAWIEAGRPGFAGRLLKRRTIVETPLILFPRRSAPAFHDIIMGYYAAQDATPLVAQEAIQMQTIISLVSAGMGIALVPRSLTNLGRVGVRYLPLEQPAPEIETGLAWRTADRSPVLLRFLALLEDDGGMALPGIGAL